ncbi:amidohydrolase [Rhodopirellula sp. JC639]|uniref:amidohydrolase n=1 Tax=Stieleria mannarensis TaxID=2755585 RepID=UPI0016004327|nr:amidohydrolase [Rhodopirellula sp. JC639]
MHLRLAIAVLTWCIPAGLVPTAGLVPAADLVLRGGKIVTVDPQFRIVQAMAVHEGRVVALGTDEQIASQIDEQTQIVDLGGRMVLPGLIDSHVHPTGASQYEADHEIPPMETIDDVLNYVRGRAAVVPKGEWIVLQQVFITRLREQRFPTRAELDSVAPDHPVWFRTGPDGSANSLALSENGIDKAFAAKYPDQVAVDPSTGAPTGVIRRSSSILKTRPDKSRKSLSQDERDDRLVELLKDYNRWGITGIIDRNCSDSARAQYARLLQSDRLTTRVRLSRSLSPNAELSQIDQRLDEIASDPLFKQPDPRLAVIGVKVFEDGGMLTGSAYFTRPWGTSTIYGIVDPRYRGMQFIDDDRLEQLVRMCASHGLAFTAHCQGDAAVEALVEAYGRVDHDIPIAPTRSSITHSSFMSPRAIAGAAKLGVGVDLQPAWLYLDARTLVAQFGSERLTHFVPLRSLLEAGVVAGGGSDHMQKIGSLRSVNPYNPFLGMWVAVTRTARWHDEPIHREQALTREQMIRFYTINNAWLMRAEDEIGSLEVGKRADIVVIDRDLLTCSDDEIRDTLVESTWLDGRPVYQSQP